MILQTQRLLLRSPDEVTAADILRYYTENKDFLRSYEPKREPEFYTLECHSELLREEQELWLSRRGCRFYIARKEEPDRTVGIIGLSNMVWGSFCSCFLGYKLDMLHRNKGYMTEAVRKVTQYAFTDLGLHRIEGNVMPRNEASAAVLKKCGFQLEGSSKNYLKINGNWEDHLHYVILNESME